MVYSMENCKGIVYIFRLKEGYIKKVIFEQLHLVWKEINSKNVMPKKFDYDSSLPWHIFIFLWFAIEMVLLKTDNNA